MLFLEGDFNVLFRNKMSAVAVAVFMSLSGNAFASSEKSPEISNENIEQSNVQIDPIWTAAKGVWERKGYAEVIEIDDNGIRFLQHNPVGCMPSASLMAQFLQLENNTLPLTETAEKLTRVSLSEDGQMLNIGAKGATDNYDSLFQRLDALPSECADGLDTSEDPIAVFDYFWNMFDRYYAFFELKNMDWQAQYDEYRPKVTAATTQDELFTILSDMVAPLQDSHVNIESDDADFNVERLSDFLHFRRGLTIRMVTDGKTEEEVLAASDAENAAYLETNVSQYLLEDEKHVVRNFDDQTIMVWGKTSQNIGVLKVNQVEGFAQEYASPAEEIAAIHNLMPTIIEALSGTEAMIIDLRYNTGGMDVVSTAIASYFTDQRVLAYRKQVRNADAEGPWREVFVEPSANPYLKPLYLITSFDTSSGAEILTAALKELPNTTHIGQNTQGGLSDLLPAVLPNGWIITLSNEVYSQADGNEPEGEGIVADVEIPAFSYQTKVHKQIESFQYVQKDLGKPSSPRVSSFALDAAVGLLTLITDIDGLALATISDGKVTHTRSFGWTDGKRNKRIKMSTPFRLGKASEMFVGHAVADLVANESFDITTSVEPSLDFTLSDEFNPTFQQLISHTSRLSDANAECFNYLTSDNRPLLNKYYAESCNEDVERNFDQLIRDYFSVDGSLNNPENLLENIKPGQIYWHSSMGVGLAAYAMKAVVEPLGYANLQAFIQQKVFSPIGMINSSWDINANKQATPSLDFYGFNASYPKHSNANVMGLEMRASARDLSKYMEALINDGYLNDNRVLEEDVVEEIFTPQVVTGHEQGTGLGYLTRLDANYMGYSENSYGNVVEFHFDKKTKNGYVLLATTRHIAETGENSASANKALNKIKKLAWWHAMSH